MIKLFKKDAIDFKSNGLGILKNVTRAEGDETLNSMWSAEFDITYDKDKKWKEIIQERIIFSDDQPFRVYNVRKNFGFITVYTRHIFWDLIHNEARDVRPTNKNCMFAMQNVMDNTNYPHNFTVYSDITRLNTQYFINKNPVNCLIGEDSIYTRWNGELKLDKFKISILNQRGRDIGVTIKYRKNMQDIEVEENYDGLITRMRPKGYDGLELPEIYVDSEYINNYHKPYIKEVDFPDIKIDEDEGITEADAINQLRNAAIKYYENTRCDIPKTNIKVDMVLLENTVEYKNFKDLVRVEVGDTVNVEHMDLGINYKSKIIRIKKNHLTGKNAEVELGTFKANLNESFNKIEDKIESTIKDVSEAIKKNKSDMQKAIDNATDLLTSALGGYVLKRPGELLIMDTEDPATATKVWRWNINGLGYSNSGVNGPYGLAMTMDGAIVADFITTGKLNAGLIKTGVIESLDGDVKINIDNGNIEVKGGSLTLKNNNGTVVIDGQSNMHKILATGLMNIDVPAGAVNYNASIAHNLGYTPAFSAYMQGDSTQPEEDGFSFALPRIVSAAGGDSLLMQSTIKGEATANRFYVRVRRAQNYGSNLPAKTIVIRYFIYKEVAF